MQDLKFSDILKVLNEDENKSVFSPEIINKGDDFIIKGLANDSRRVDKDFVFFAIKGYKDDGSSYIADAINRGSLAIITDSEKSVIYKEICEKNNIWLIIVKNIRRLLAQVSANYFGNPSRKLKMIGVTGTNGKTTITYLIKHILDNFNIRCGLIGTVDYITGEEKKVASLTTPDSIDIQYMLSEMVENNCEYCVMEVSSIALTLDRVYGIDYIAAVFSNLTSEHLDLHLNMENYFNAKKILFDNLSSESIAISNLDDEYGEKILSSTQGRKVFYTLEKDTSYLSRKFPLYKATDTKFTIEGLQFNLIYENKNYFISSELTGRFNIYNILAALATISELGYPLETAVEAVKSFKPVNGRFNPIRLYNGAYAIIDYSHTSDSLKNAILAAREILNMSNLNSRVITIFGCGGNKDRTKRPVMGKFAAEYSDYCIVTSDNPRYEEPLDIIKEILIGMEGKSNFEVEENREKAIKRGIELSKENDLILICGKGHEDYQEIKGVKYHFDDREIVEKYNKEN
ncbi:MAG: UDP-N-acetylmuramoyl-L-alanyl-D-glutamate--2,6-diaminopimelate ligase [Ignavibacteria bacterium]|nr:UDP-N-acetylmuramoyl-L-alanyl-D-glutamate--2,6-diaminopimelate ligase [Ignavibacteria bacterium]